MREYRVKLSPGLEGDVKLPDFYDKFAEFSGY